MVEGNQNFASNPENSLYKVELFSIDFLHVSDLVTVDARPIFADVRLDLVNKDEIDRDILNEIVRSVAETGDVDEYLSRIYAQQVFEAMNKRRVGPLGLGLLSITIKSGPINMFFRTTRWQELKEQFAGRVSFDELGRALSVLTAEERSNLQADVILGNKLAGVRTVWSPEAGYVRGYTQEDFLVDNF